VTAGGAALDGQAMAGFCGSHLAKFKVPKRFVAAESLPRNATGKIVKADLKQQYTSQA